MKNHCLMPVPWKETNFYNCSSSNMMDLYNNDKKVNEKNAVNKNQESLPFEIEVLCLNIPYLIVLL